MQQGAKRHRRSPTRSPGVLSHLLAGVLLSLLVGCASVSAASSGSATASGGSWKPPPCHRPLAAPVVAAPVPGVPSDWTITSFDGTKIRAHWFPVAGATPQRPAPTVLMGPGWGESGDTDLSGTGDVFGTVSISDLHRAGYNVLTWDPRGFGKSTGTIEVDSPGFEAKDVSRLIDWVATRPGVELDGPGDPRMGMVGGSYGGGIQWVTAAQDCRIDAIVPTISWHSLTTSLDKSGIAKIGWANLLLAAAAGHSLDPHIVSSSAEANSTGQIDPANEAWFAARGPGDLVSDIHIPTLIVQGTVDTLFTLDEGVANYERVRADHVPVSMLWFCGGHGVCLTDQGNPSVVERATIDWLNRWVKRDPSVGTGPRVDLIDQHGVRYAAAGYPLPTVAPLRGRGAGPSLSWPPVVPARSPSRRGVPAATPNLPPPSSPSCRRWPTQRSTCASTAAPERRWWSVRRSSTSPTGGRRRPVCGPRRCSRNWWTIPPVSSWAARSRPSPSPSTGPSTRSRSRSRPSVSRWRPTRP